MLADQSDLVPRAYSKIFGVGQVSQFYSYIYSDDHRRNNSGIDPSLIDIDRENFGPNIGLPGFLSGFYCTNDWKWSHYLSAGLHKCSWKG